MCEFTPSDPFIAELRAQHHQRTEQRMDNQITVTRKPLPERLRDSPLRHRREGIVLAQHGTARVLVEAEQAPDNRKRIAAWRNRYALVPVEMTV